MNEALPHNKLRVHYLVLQQGETATVWVAGTTAGDTVPERWPAWLSMSRTQWVPALLEGEQLEWEVQVDQTRGQEQSGCSDISSLHAPAPSVTPGSTN
jgi:hypothetical protein